MITEIKDFNIRHLNTFRMDVSCGRFIEYDNEADLHGIISGLAGQEWLHIGSGSNLLFTSNYPGAILHSRILEMEADSDGDNDVLLRAGSGIEMDSLIEQVCQSGLWGLENLSGIPGEVGASAVQNVGAYGVEAKDVIKTVECYDSLTDSFVKFSAKECDYGYRNSVFKRPGIKGRYVITYVTFRLSKMPKPILDYGHVKSKLGSTDNLTPARIRETILEMRNEKLPDISMVGSAGSFFKNPVLSNPEFEDFLKKTESLPGGPIVPPHYKLDNGIKIPAAWLIEKSGLKGYTQGNAATWHTQPLVIVNKTGLAAPAEILALEDLIIDTVYSRFGIKLTPEVEHISIH